LNGLHIDWQLVAFVSVSVFHDYWVNSHLPKIYYWEAKKGMNGDHRNAA
jgi:hypothetical protein